MSDRIVSGGRWTLVTASLLWAVAGASSLRAQQLEVLILGGQVSDESGAVGRGVTIAPAVAWTAPTRWLRLEGRGTALEGGGRLMGAGAGFYLGHRSGPVELGASGSASVIGAGGGFRSSGGEVNPGIRVGTGAASVGAGVGARVLSLSSSPPAWREALPFSRENERTRVARSVWAEGRTALGTLSLSVLARASRVEERAWREAQAVAQVPLGALTVSGFAGARSGDDHGQWGGAGASLRVAPGVELLAQIAQTASDPLSGQPGARTATLGVSLSMGAPRAASPGRSLRAVRLAMSAAPAARVELLGDWNDWRPELLTDQGGGVFAREIRLPPGTYHFVFRVNGVVRVPEGYETAPDEFGGKSAVLRVRG
jgi:hypothetical protein